MILQLHIGHHIKPIYRGGIDQPEDIIPLCGQCHQEWDIFKEYGMDFGDFLTTLPEHTIARLYSVGAFRAEEKIDLSIIYRLQFTGRAFSHDNDPEAYWDLLKEQNQFFCKYPYSDHRAMLEAHGDGGRQNFPKNQKGGARQTVQRGRNDVL